MALFTTTLAGSKTSLIEELFLLAMQLNECKKTICGFCVISDFLDELRELLISMRK
jgi:hypothetical protein